MRECLIAIGQFWFLLLSFSFSTFESTEKKGNIFIDTHSRKNVFATQNYAQKTYRLGEIINKNSGMKTKPKTKRNEIAFPVMNSISLFTTNENKSKFFEWQSWYGHWALF